MASVMQSARPIAPAGPRTGGDEESADVSCSPSDAVSPGDHVRPRRAGTIAPAGARLAALMRERGWNIADLHRASGVSFAQLSLFLRGGIENPRADTLGKIAGAFPVRVSELFGEPATEFVKVEVEVGCIGVVLVPVIAFGEGGGYVETDDTVPVPSTLMDERGRLIGVVITAAGAAPHVLIGDTVVTDVDAGPADRALVVIRHQGSTLAAWCVRPQNNGACVYRLSDGSWLDADVVEYVGAAVKIQRDPPRFPG